MASRRLAISSLLNDGGNNSAAQHHASSSPPPPSSSSSSSSFPPPSYHQPQVVPEPVVLAPHLITNPSHRAHQVDYPPPQDLTRDGRSKDTHPHAPSSAHRRFSTPPTPAGLDIVNSSRRQKGHSEYFEPDIDRTRLPYPNYRSEQPPQSRPSSSRSSNSPHVTYRYPQPNVGSPVISSGNAPLAMPEGFTPSVPSQRPAVPQTTSYPRHPRPNSQSRSVDHPQANPYPQPQASQTSSVSNPNASQFNMLLHIATEERRKLSSGNEVADASPNPSSPPGHQFSHRHQFGGTSDQTAYESVKKTSEWQPKNADRNDGGSNQQATYPHRNRGMSIHDQLLPQPQLSVNRSSPHLSPPTSDPFLSHAESSNLLSTSRLQAQNAERQQKLEETRQKTEEQRRRHQMRLEEQKLLNDQREQRQQQRLQQQREHERLMMSEATARERVRMGELERERQTQQERAERSRASVEVSPPHHRPPSSMGVQPSVISQGAPTNRRPLSMESLLHPQPSPLPQLAYRPSIDTSSSSVSSAGKPRLPHSSSTPHHETSHPRLSYPSRKSDPGQPSLALQTSPRLKPTSSPMSSLPPTLSNLVTAPAQKPISPSIQALLSPSHSTIRLPPPLSDPRPLKKPRVSTEDLPATQSTSRLTLREEQTLNAIRSEQQRRAEEAAARKAREEEKQIQELREKLRRDRTREMQMEREREAQREHKDRVHVPEHSDTPWDKLRTDPRIEERKSIFPSPISAESSNILGGLRTHQVIQLLPREDPPAEAPPAHPHPAPHVPTQERVSPPRVVKLEAVEGPVDVRQPKRLPPGSQEGRAKAARRADTAHVMQDKKDTSVRQISELRTDMDVKVSSESAVLSAVKSAIENQDAEDEEGGPGRAKQVAKEKKGSRTHSLLRTSDSIPKRVSSPHSVTRFEVEKPPPQLQSPSQLSPKEPHPQKDHPPQADAHEWLLEHYSAKPSSSPHEGSAPGQFFSAAQTSAASEAEVVLADASGPNMADTISEDAVAALEQELEDILMEEPETDADPSNPDSHPRLQADVDITVAELVAETLDGDAARPEPQARKTGPDSKPASSMEVDMEDELLSLVDDHPPQSAFPSRGSPPLAIKDNRKATSKVIDAGPMLAATSAEYAPPLPLLSSGSSVRATPERRSMPPPAPKLSTIKSKEKDLDKGDGQKGERSTSAPMKKKPAPKPKTTSATATTKPRTKPGPKGKVKNDAPTTNKVSKSSTTKKAPPASARSRSASAMPSGSVGPDAETVLDKEKEKENEPEDDADEDDKLYCVCKTKYDEDRVMIACDRCDEWYHTQCVSMPDLEVDLVDQFICPPCAEQNPHLSLCTTYKKRCLFGLSHTNPSSPDACHKPARGALSKYCSDECGYRCVQARIDDWTKRGGKRETLWENVKDAEKREGVVIRHDSICGRADSQDTENKLTRIKPEKTKAIREIERLRDILDHVVLQREEIKRGMEVVGWRERLLELAAERSQQLGQCGWDQRLCFGDEEWTEFGGGVLESYEELANGDDEGEWWCPGPTKCERHAGWQGVRHKDIQKEKENKEEALLKLTTRERELRKLIEDLTGQYRSKSDASSKSPLAFSNNKLSNGHSNNHSKTKINGDVKKGKKRKALA